MYLDVTGWSILVYRADGHILACIGPVEALVALGLLLALALACRHAVLGVAATTGAVAKRLEPSAPDDDARTETVAALVRLMRRRDTIALTGGLLGAAFSLAWLFVFGWPFDFEPTSPNLPRGFLFSSGPVLVLHTVIGMSVGWSLGQFLGSLPRPSTTRGSSARILPASAVEHGIGPRRRTPIATWLALGAVAAYWTWTAATIVRTWSPLGGRIEAALFESGTVALMPFAVFAVVRIATRLLRTRRLLARTTAESRFIDDLRADAARRLHLVIVAAGAIAMFALETRWRGVSFGFLTSSNAAGAAESALVTSPVSPPLVVLGVVVALVGVVATCVSGLPRADSAATGARDPARSTRRQLA